MGTTTAEPATMRRGFRLRVEAGAIYVEAAWKRQTAAELGVDSGTPVSPTYGPPFEFTGTLNEVTIEVT
jgi:hypothetical protein